jgi:hypothetical protein
MSLVSRMMRVGAEIGLFTLALALVLGTAQPLIAFAQSSEAPGTEVARLQYTDFADAPLRSGPRGVTGSLALIVRDAVVAVPLTSLDAPAIWFTGGFARTVTLGFSGFSAGHPGLASVLNQRGLVLGTQRHLDNGASFVGVLAAGYFAASDDYNVPLSIGGYGLWTWSLSDHSRWGIGASATAELGDPGLLPLLHYESWHSNWTANITLPLDADVRWWLTRSVNVGGQWQARGGSYNATDGKLPFDEVRYRTGSASAVLGIGGRTGPLLDVTLGRTVYRRYRELQDKASVLTLDFKPETVISAKTAWRF